MVDKFAAGITIISPALAILLGTILTFSYLPNESEILQTPTISHSVAQKDGTVAITYKTNGTKISSFSSCDQEIDSDLPCLIFTLDGNPGIVDFAIPKDMLKNFSDVSAGYFNEKKIKFQLIGE